MARARRCNAAPQAAGAHDLPQCHCHADSADREPTSCANTGTLSPAISVDVTHQRRGCRRRQRGVEFRCRAAPRSFSWSVHARASCRSKQLTHCCSSGLWLMRRANEGERWYGTSQVARIRWFVDSPRDRHLKSFVGRRQPMTCSRAATAKSECSSSLRGWPPFRPPERLICFRYENPPEVPSQPPVRVGAPP